MVSWVSRRSLGGVLVVVVVKVVVLLCERVQICTALIWYALAGFSFNMVVVEVSSDGLEGCMGEPFIGSGPLLF